jgi:hypothetical protein
MAFVLALSLPWLLDRLVEYSQELIASGVG